MKLLAYKKTFIAILFVCTVVYMYGVDKLDNKDNGNKKYQRNVAGIIDARKLSYSKEKYRNILEKNVFSNSRDSVFTPAKKVEKKEKSKESSFVVNGIFTSPRESIVMVSEMQSHKTHFVAVGESIEEWVLDSVDKNKVVFVKNNGERNIFELNNDGSEK